MTDRLYLRISADSATSGAIDKQGTQLRRRANPDDHVVYTDRSISGKVDFADRPEGARLLADLRPGDRVLATRIDRLARNTEALLALVRTFETAGADLVLTEQNIDTSGPMGSFMLTLLGAVATLERDIVAERVRETRESFREQGRFAGGPIPYGFTTAPHPAGRGLVLRPDPATADIARDVIRRVMAGESQRSLADVLGMKESGLSRWLHNPVLAGIRPGTAELEIDAGAALLSLPEWEALQNYLDRPLKAWNKADGYGAALVCGVCGERLYYARNKRYPASSVYRCRRARHKDGEPAASVVRRHADIRVEDDFLARFGADPVIETVTVSSSAARDEALALARVRLDAAQRAQREAGDREARRAAAEAVESALDALDEAEALPDETVTEERDTGLTHEELWNMLGPAERIAYVVAVGPWVVSPGRGLTIEEKVKHAGVGRRTGT